MKYALAFMSTFLLMGADAMRLPGQSTSQAKSITAVEASRALRMANPSSSSVVRTLAQESGPVQLTLLRAIADTLIGISMSPITQIPEKNRREAVFALGMAGRSSTGVPYPGSARALFKIAMEADERVGQTAVMELAALPNPISVVPLLIRIARSNRMPAVTAIRLLNIPKLSNVGNPALRTLWESSEIKLPLACQVLGQIANGQRWPRTPATSCERH